jgi:electron transfer flavoprotein alpha subunit
VSVRPKLYVAFGVSGATQHTGGLGAPGHIASINTDAHCPMTVMSSLGIIADARGTLAELAAALGVEVAGPPASPEESRDA